MSNNVLYNSSRRNINKEILSNYAAWFLLVIVFLIGAGISKIFYTKLNLLNIIEGGATLGLIALAETVVLITGNFDLSVENNMIFTAIVGAYLASSGPMALGINLNPYLTIILMIICGAGIGLINGLLVAYYKASDFMTTLATLSVLAGLNLFISPKNYGLTIRPLPKEFIFLGSSQIASVPVSLFVLLIIYLLFYFILTRTPFGRSLYAVGGNRNAAIVTGINVKRVICLAYILSGAICGFAGVLLSGRFQAAMPSLSVNLLFFAVASSVVGGVSLSGGIGTIQGLFGGVLLILVINNVLNLSGAEPTSRGFLLGLIIFFAMVVDTIRRRLLEK